jgi:hypothetical protein
MTRDQLEHAIRAACDVSDDTKVYVFGSQAILPVDDELRGIILSWLDQTTRLIQKS